MNIQEYADRDMLAVVYLNNYWEWSGGMAQYVAWLDDEPVPNPVLEQYSWPQFMEFSARFYAHAEANAATTAAIRGRARATPGRFGGMFMRCFQACPIGLRHSIAYLSGGRNMVLTLRRRSVRSRTSSCMPCLLAWRTASGRTSG